MEDLILIGGMVYIVDKVTGKRRLATKEEKRKLEKRKPVKRKATRKTTKRKAKK